MISVRRPSEATIVRFLSEQVELKLSYSDIGATAGLPAKQYTVDHNRILLGHGAETFASAKLALHHWEHFQLGWITPYYFETTISEDKVVGVLAKTYGLWFLNACRIVYLVEEEGPTHRSGFAYGTLPDHAEAGEERFAIEWNQEDYSVWYDILAFSKPNKWYTKLCQPIVRKLQKQFASDSLTAMQNATRQK
ncbi:DUF1990 domain-containing protein [bacterium]|jgi:uncharacterized protein (UPF0548 family)|nr:DUF1990 domain-containing protein [bacterium]